MILDTLSRWRDYGWNSNRFEAAFRFLEAMTPDMADGKHVIDGDTVFCMIGRHETKPREGQEFEAHRDYADIQYIVQGVEAILWAPVPELTVVKPYEPDAELYALTESPTELILRAGQFCVLFPQDAHAPCIAHDKPSAVRKAVVKVRLA